MTWTKEDTEALRVRGRLSCGACDPIPFNERHDHGSQVEWRAADEIERLRAKVAEMERTKYDCLAGDACAACRKCLALRIAELEAERAEVAKELRRHEDQARETGCLYSANRMGDIAERLERKGE